MKMELHLDLPCACLLNYKQFPAFSKLPKPIFLLIKLQPAMLLFGQSCASCQTLKVPPLFRHSAVITAPQRLCTATPSPPQIRMPGHLQSNPLIRSPLYEVIKLHS